jgi:alpha-tubulin suppressor-like RCC1 family protein
LVVLSPELVASVPQEELAGARVVVLDTAQEVMGQIGAALQAHPGTTVVRVISHGEPGALFLAGQRLSRETLRLQSAAMAGWRQHLAPGAEILLYGCCVAATPEGRSFVHLIAELTGAEVAASASLTGSAAKGGDLSLGYTTGPIGAITERFLQAWDQSGLILVAPVFTSAASANFSRTVAGSFAVAASGLPTYSIAPATLFESSFITLPSDWVLSNAQISGGSVALNPATPDTNGTLILPKLGTTSPGSFTASFDYTAGNVTVGGTKASGTSFNYGALSASTASALGMVGSNGLAVSFLEAYTKAGAVTTTVPSSVEVRWNGTPIASAPVSFGSGAKPVQIKLDAANLLMVSYDHAQVLNTNLSGLVNAADRSNWQFALGSANTSQNASSHSIDNLAIVTNGGLPAGLSLNPTTGEISGTPTAAASAGQHVFNLVATNADGATSQPFRLNLASGAPVFSSSSTQATLPGVPTTIAITAAGSAGPTTYSVAPQTLISTTLANAAALPAGAYINGTSRFNSGAIELTQNKNNQTSWVQFLGQGDQNPTPFTASFNYKVGGGTTVGGGGISFNYGNPGDHSKGLRVVITELPTSATSNANLEVAVWLNGLRVSGTTVANPFTGALYSSNTYLPVKLAMSAEGRLQVSVNNVLASDTTNVTGWQTTDKSLWAFGFTGTTGASNNNFHTIKDVVIGTNGVLPPGLTLDPATGVISGQLGIGTAVDPYVHVTATNAAGSTTQLVKLDVSASNTLPGQRPGTGTSLGGPDGLGATGEQFRNLSAFAALTTDGQVKVWGNTLNGGLQAEAPTGTGYTVITSNERAFAALKNDGSIVSWGFGANGATGEPTGTGYQMISASRDAFAAIKNDGSIVAWGNTANGGSFGTISTSSPTGTGYLRIFANGGGFTAQKSDGTIRAWGNSSSIGSGAPPVPPTTNFTRVTANGYQASTNSFGAFAGLDSKGSIITWGSTATAPTAGKPGSSGWQDIVPTAKAFAAIDSNGTIAAWGDSAFGGGSTSTSPTLTYLKAPTDSGYRQLYGNSSAFVAVRQDGSLAAWGNSINGGSGAPTGTGYTQVYSTLNSFAALKADGSISVWGSALEGGNIKVAPLATATGYTNLFSSQGAFAALKGDGSVTVWGDTSMGGTGGPTGTGWTEITSSGTAFAARKTDGSLYSWGSSLTGGTGAPTGSNYLTVQSPTLAKPYFPQAAGAPVNLAMNQTVPSQLFLGIQGDGLNFTITNGKLPGGLKLDAATGWIHGNPAEPGTFPLTINATSAAGSVTQNYTLRVESSLLPNQRQGTGAVYSIGSGTEVVNTNAYAGLTANGSIYAWGQGLVGGTGAPTGTGYTQITSNADAYAALKVDGSISAWGKSTSGGTGSSGVPTGTGYTKIYASRSAFAALKTDGSITAWGNTVTGGSGAPSGTGFTKIYTTTESFAAQKADGSITVWGDTANLGGKTPTGTGYTSITPNAGAYAALTSNGSITAWGNTGTGGSGAPAGTGYTKIFASPNAYAALKNDGSIAVWGATATGGTNAPTGTGFVDIWSSGTGFAALKTDGSLASWGASGANGTATPTGTGYTQVFSTQGSFAALKADGSIVSWGATLNDAGSGAPTGTGYTTIYSSQKAFAALKADGSITTWGHSDSGGSGAPAGTGYTQIFSRSSSFAAMKADGTVSVWGQLTQTSKWSSLVPFGSIQNATAVVPAREFGLTGNLPAARNGTSLATQALGMNGTAAYQVGANNGLGLGSAITAGSLPDGLSLNVATGYLEGTATKSGTSNFTVTTYNGSGQSSQAYSLTVTGSSTSTAAPTFSTAKPIGYANYAIGKPASYDLSAVATPTTVPLNYSRIAGTLPPGMTLQTNGTVAGTPTTPGTYQFTLAASDSKGVATQTFTIEVSGDTPNQRPGQYSAIAAGSSGSQGINESAFAALRPNGSIVTWGDSAAGGAGATGVPTDLGYVQIAQTNKAFAGLRYDGAIQSWGHTASGGLGAPTDSGYTRLFSNGSAFAALKANGSIVSWGADNAGGSGEPTDTGYSQIFTNSESMVALKTDGSLVAWGNSATGGSSAPTGTGYVTITANATAFAALKGDGSLWAWGNSTNGGLQPTLPTNNSYTAIYSNPNGFAALRADGTIATWGNTLAGDVLFTGGNNFVSIASNSGAFAALRADGTVTAWGNSFKGGTGTTGTGFTALYSTDSAFTGLKADSSMASWGNKVAGGDSTPAGTGYITIVSNPQAFTALKNDGTVVSWGNASFGGKAKAPAGSLFTQVFSTSSAFVAQKTDGSLVAWGNSTSGGSGVPTATGLTVSSARAAIPYQPAGTSGELPTAYLGKPIGPDGGAGPAAYQVGAYSQGSYSRITAGALPGGLALDAATGFLFGTPAGLAGTYTFTITTTSAVDSTVQAYTLDVKDPLAVIAPNQRVGSGASFSNGTGQSARNQTAFAALKTDGSITAWGDSTAGGSGAPTGTGFTQIYSSGSAFAALKADGSITAWGSTSAGGSNAPTGTGYTQIYSTGSAFAALKADGSITTWGDATYGGTGGATGTGFTQMYSSGRAFAALQADGAITAWGDANYGGTGAPTGTGYTQVYSTGSAFTALKADGSLTAWGSNSSGGTGAPTGTGYTQVYSTGSAFTALKADGSITAWGNTANGGSGAPVAAGFKQVFSNTNAFAALNGNGTITAWGSSLHGGKGAPTTSGYKEIYSTGNAFAALKADGSITAWGDSSSGGTGAPAPTATGFTKIYSSEGAFAALTADGSITAWGGSGFGGSGAPAGTGFTQIYSTNSAFAAQKADGSITVWGSAANGGSGAPAGSFATVQSALVSDPEFAAFPANSALSTKANLPFFANLGAQGVGSRYEIAVGNLPTGLTLDPTTGVLSGIPTASGNYSFILAASNPAGVDTQVFNLAVDANATAPVFVSAKTTTAKVGTSSQFQVSAQGTGVSYALSKGTLPSGLTLNASTGLISGTPANVTNGTPSGGIHTLVITATNNAGSTTQDFTLTLNQAPEITSTASLNGTPGASVNIKLDATGFPKPTFKVVSGSLPNGLSLSTSGELSGIANAASLGSTTLIIEASNNIGTAANKTFTLTMAAMAATALKIVAPSAVVSGKANTVEVQAVDAYGNVDKNATGTVTLQPTGAGSLELTGSGGLTANLINGVATFQGLVYKASADNEEFKLGASATGLSSAPTQVIGADVVATEFQILGTPSASTLESGVANSLSGLRLVAVDAAGRIDTQWLGSGQTVKLTLTKPNGTSLLGSVNALALASGNALSDTDTNATTITLGSNAIRADGSIDLGALQLQYTNPSGTTTEALALKAERIGGSDPVLTGVLSSSLTSSSTVATNSAPQLNLDLANAPAAYSENGTAIAVVGSGASVSDADTTLQSLQVAITNVQVGDLLALATTPSGLTANYDTSSGLLLIKASANASPTLDDFTSALKEVRYSNSSENPNTTPRQITVTANDGSGLSSATGTATRTLTVSAVDDPTTLTNLPGSINATEDTQAPLNLGSLVLSDLDSGDTQQTLTLSVTKNAAPSGSLSASNGPGVTVTGSNSAQVSLEGTISDLNNYLRTSGVLNFTPASNANGSHALSFAVVTGGSSQSLGSTTINVAPVNDPGVFSGVPAAGSVASLRHGVATTLQSLIGNTPISVADLDVDQHANRGAAGRTDLTLTVTNASLAGLSDGVQNGGATLTINSATSWLVNGTLAQINAVLAAPTITLQSATAGAVNLSLQLNDGSNVTGSTTTAAVQFLAASDPILINSASSSARSISAGFDESLSFLTITDPDAGSNPQTFTLSISDPGNAATLSGLTDANSGTSGIQLTGTAAQINAQLADGRYKASALGSSSLQLSLSNGLAPAINSTANFTGSNPLPTLTQISNLTGAKEDQPFAISFSDLAAVANDADQGGSVEGFVVKAVSSGTLKIGTTEQLATPWAANTNDKITPILNAYWNAAANANGTGGSAITAFTVTALDNSNGESTTPVAVKVEVSPVNDTPSIAGLPVGGSSVSTGISSALADFTVADIDSNALTLTLRPVNGSIGGLTDAENNREGIQLSGTAAQINTAIAAATFTAATSGAASIKLQLEDGGSETVSDVYNLTATAVNNPPTLSTPGSTRNITTGVSDALSYITASDSDAGQSLTLTLTATGGTFRNVADADLNSAGFQLNGTASAINAALAAGSFVASADGAANITASVTDGVITTPVSATYNLNASNAAPTLTTVSALSGAKEDLAFTITAADLMSAANEADPGGNVAGFVVTSVDTNKGTLRINGSVYDAANNNLINADRKAEWTSAVANSNGAISGAFMIKAIDDSNQTSSSAVAVTINVAAVNDAPAANGSNYSISTNELTPTAGVVVSTLLSSGRGTDIDNANLGVAVTAFNGRGAWQVSTTNGSSRTALGTCQPAAPCC